jgi:hypothetical protein
MSFGRVVESHEGEGAWTGWPWFSLLLLVGIGLATWVAVVSWLDRPPRSFTSYRWWFRGFCQGIALVVVLIGWLVSLNLD